VFTSDDWRIYYRNLRMINEAAYPAVAKALGRGIYEHAVVLREMLEEAERRIGRKRVGEEVERGRSAKRARNG
jgi:hypothetical protein